MWDMKDVEDVISVGREGHGGREGRGGWEGPEGCG